MGRVTYLLVTGLDVSWQVLLMHMHKCYRYTRQKLSQRRKQAFKYVSSVVCT